MKKTIGIAVLILMATLMQAQNFSSSCVVTTDPEISVCETTIGAHTVYTEVKSNGDIRTIKVNIYKLYLELIIKARKAEIAKLEAAPKNPLIECFHKAEQIPWDSSIPVGKPQPQADAMIACMASQETK